MIGSWEGWANPTAEAGGLRPRISINPAYTSQRCSACGTVNREARESQAVFRCRSCGYACNADVNAAENILRAGLALRDAAEAA